MAFLKKLGTAKEKFKFKVSIHSLRATLPTTCQVFLKVKRGKKIVQDTETVLYTPPA